jgi:DNA-binding transcriptional LysR family regulator
MSSLNECAPGVRVESTPFAHDQIALALDSGTLDFAIGFLPTVHGTQRMDLLADSYIVLLREGHPFVSAKRKRPVTMEELAELEYVAVRSHSETLRILQMLHLEERVRLTAAHFLALPAIVRTTDLGVVMPRAIAAGSWRQGGIRSSSPSCRSGSSRCRCIGAAVTKTTRCIDGLSSSSCSCSSKWLEAAFSRSSGQPIGRLR